MQITKFGHCCLLLEINGVRLLTDPGNFSEAQNEAKNIDAIVITHEHGDHMHIPSIKAVLANNPTAQVVGNSAVAKLVGEQVADVAVVVVGDGQSTDIKGVLVEGFGKDHALVYPPDMGLCENTGYLIDSKFYFPGDNFHNPEKPIDVLALPVAGPWMKIADAVDFAKAVKARTAFGVHDGMIQPFFRGFTGMLLSKFVPETTYVSLADGEAREF